MDDRYNGLCVLEYIGRGSHNNRLLCLGSSKFELTLAVSHFEIGAIASRIVSALPIKNGISTDRIVTYKKYESY